MPSLLGTAPNQVSVNSDLGKLAFMDVVDTVTNNPYLDTAISDTKPSLLLDFANSKTLDPRITYTRASTASYYDGKTTAVAEQNLLTYSQVFNNAAWAYNDSPNPITSSATTAPDGTNTGNLFIPTTANVYHAAKQAPTMTNGVVYTMSVYGKSKEYNYVYLLTYDGNGLKTTSFNVSTGTIGTVASNHTATISAAANGWYRCTITFTLSSAATGMYFGVSNADNTPSYAGDGTSGVYLWGAQLEQRSSVSSYTPTTSAAITNYIPALQTAAAGVPRFDHDPVTGESKGFLIEEQRTNVTLYSDDLSNAAWNKQFATVVSNSIVAPDGTLTGDKIVEGTTADAYKGAYSTASTNVDGTASIYAKAAERNWLLVRWASVNTWFNLANGSVGTVGSGITATITPVGNGWYRCSVYSASTAGVVGCYVANADNSTAYTGNGYSGIYIWGCQAEAGSFATSYIPTTSAQVTRSADAASMTGGNFSSWYNPAEGCWYTEAAGRTTGVYTLAASDGSTSNRNIQGFGNIRVVSGGSDQCDIYSSSGLTANAFYKTASSYKSNDFAVSGNSGAVATDFVGSVPSVNQLQISANGVGSVYSTTIKKLAYYPKRLSNAELQEMTQ